MGLRTEPLGEMLVSSLTGERVEHPPVAAGDAIGGEELVHLLGDTTVDELQPEAEGPVAPVVGCTVAGAVLIGVVLIGVHY